MCAIRLLDAVLPGLQQLADDAHRAEQVRLHHGAGPRAVAPQDYPDQLGVLLALGFQCRRGKDRLLQPQMAVALGLIEQRGAAAVATTSAGLAWAQGYADGDRLDPDVLLQAVSRIARVIRAQPRGVGGEIQLTDGIAGLLAQQTVYAFRYAGTRYDCGSKEGFLEATVDLAMARADLAPSLQRVMRRWV